MSELRCPNCRCHLELTTTGTESFKTFNIPFAITEYAAEQGRTGAWSAGWAKAAESQLRRFSKGEHSIDRPGIAAFRAELVDQGLVAKTVNLYLTTLSGFCRWLVNRGDLAENPCSGQNVRNGHAAKCEQRLAFTPDEVRTILAYVRGKSPTIGHAGFVWAMAYTGARNEEVGQLRVCDLTHRDNIVVFDMHDMEGKQHRKNEASRRLVPVSTVLLRELRRILHQPLQTGSGHDFSNLWGFSTNSVGRCSYGAARWFNRKVLPALKKQGAVRDDPRLTLYSLRHSVLTQLKHKGISELLISELAGHANSSETTGRYGKRFPVEKLREVIEKLVW